jgi:hypothetical protein
MPKLDNNQGGGHYFTTGSELRKNLQHNSSTNQLAEETTEFAVTSANNTFK